jgi:circadian clock protein KaiC
MAVQRLASGIPGFDEIVHGGFVAGRTYLAVGAAGTGKTIFATQWLLEGVRAGERSLYITLAEPAEEIVRNMAVFGWQLDGLELVDLSSGAPDETGGEYHFFAPSEVEHVHLWETIRRTVEERRPTRLMIDSLTQLRYLSTEEYQFRKQVLALVTFLNRAGCTTILAFEPVELMQQTAVALAVDGVIKLDLEISASRAIGLRSLQVEKLRGSDFMSGLHPFRISHDGIHVYPHRIETAGNNVPGTRQLASGIAQLDELLGGGLETGTTTLVSGPTGVGKSTLGTHFVVEAVARGERCVLFTFEESVNSVIVRARNIGLPIDERLTGDRLRIIRLNPMELYPDEFLAMVRRHVEQEARTVVMIDSLRGYQLAMDQFGSPLAHMHNLAIYLNRMNVTTLLINEVENITGQLIATELGVSHMADNIVLLRYAEYGGQVNKVIGCLKKRLGNFQPELRALTINGDGIHVSEKLAQLRGILTGVPTSIS